MRQANRALELRHKVTHAGYVPSLDEANLVLSCVRTILSIFELPEAYKGNWKRKPIRDLSPNAQDSGNQSAE